MIKKRLLLLSLFVTSLNGAQAVTPVLTELWGYSPVTIDLTITSNLPTTTISGTLKGIATTTTTANEKVINLKNADLIKYLAATQVIPNTKYTLQMITFYNPEGGTSAPNLYAVPVSGSAALVLLSSNLFATNTVTNGSVAVSATNLKTNVPTFTWDGAFTNLGTVNLFDVRLVLPGAMAIPLNLSLPCVSVQNFKTKYLPVKAYPTGTYYPVYEVSWVGTFFGNINNFFYNGTFYSGIAAGVIGIDAPTKFLPGQAPAN